MRTFLGCCVLTALLGVLALVPLQRAEAGTPVGIRISLVSSLFRDAPDSLVKLLARPMLALMENQTGLVGELQPSSDAQALAEQLKSERTQLGVFHGFELAWVRQKYPELKPLVVVVGQPAALQAFLIVRADCKIVKPVELKGQLLSMPAMSREHCHLFLEQRCCAGKAPGDFFKKVRNRGDASDCLVDVCEGYTQAALVEKGVLDDFSRNRPEQWKKLRVLLTSETFPAGVIAYYEGAVDAVTLRRFREGMISAHESDRGKELLKMCRITRFSAVPDDYDQQLKAILKAYPAPSK